MPNDPLVVLILDFSIVHFAKSWGSLLTTYDDTQLVKTALRAFGLGFALVILLILGDVLFRLPRDMNVLGLSILF